MYAKIGFEFQKHETYYEAERRDGNNWTKYKKYRLFVGVNHQFHRTLENNIEQQGWCRIHYAILCEDLLILKEDKIMENKNDSGMEKIHGSFLKSSVHCEQYSDKSMTNWISVLLYVIC